MFASFLFLFGFDLPGLGFAVLRFIWDLLPVCTLVLLD